MLVAESLRKEDGLPSRVDLHDLRLKLFVFLLLIHLDVEPHVQRKVLVIEPDHLCPVSLLAQRLLDPLFIGHR